MSYLISLKQHKSLIGQPISSLLLFFDCLKYVLGPTLAAVLLTFSPKMDWFWVITGAILLVPAASLRLIKSYETKRQQLEEIEKRT